MRSSFDTVAVTEEEEEEEEEEECGYNGQGPRRTRHGSTGRAERRSFFNGMTSLVEIEMTPVLEKQRLSDHEIITAVLLLYRRLPVLRYPLRHLPRRPLERPRRIELLLLLNLACWVLLRYCDLPNLEDLNRLNLWINSGLE